MIERLPQTWSKCEDSFAGLAPGVKVTQVESTLTLKSILYKVNLIFN